MNQFIRLHLRYVLLLLLSFFMPVLANAQSPQIRTVYLTPDGPAINSYIGGSRLTAGLIFGSASQVGSATSAGTFPFIVARTADTTQILLGGNLALETAKRKNVLIMNILDSIGAQVLDYDLTLPEVAGTASLRLLHASPNVDPVDIKIISSTGGTATLNDFAYTGTTLFVDLPSGTTTIEVYAGGTQQLILRGRANLAERTHYTAILSGLAPNPKIRLLNETNTGEESPMLIMQEPTASISRLRVVHGLPLVPAFDLYVDGAKAAAGVAFRDASISLPVASGDHQIAITAAGAPLASAFFSSPVTFQADFETTAFALGTVPAPFNMLSMNRLVTTTAPAGKTLVRVIHGARDVGNIDINLHGSDGQTLNLNTLIFAGADTYHEVASGPFTIDLAPQGGVTFYRAKGNLPSGGVVTILATSTSSSQVMFNMLIDSDTSRQAPMLALTPVGKSAFRAVHAAAAASPVDLYTDANPDAPETFSYRDAGEKNLNVFAGTFNVKATAEGSPTILVDTDIELKGDSLATFILMDNPTGGVTSVTLQTGAMTPASGKSFLRLLPASAFSIPVDAELTFSDGWKHRFENIAFGIATEYVEVPAGNTSLSLFAAGSSTPLITIEGNLPADAVLTGLATGLVSQGTLDIRVLIDSKSDLQAPMLPFEVASSVPAETGVSQGSLAIAPNPASATTRLTYSLPRTEQVRLALYDALGRLVRVIADKRESQGEHTTVVATDGIPAGVYTVVITGEKGVGVASSQLTVVK